MKPYSDLALLCVRSGARICAIAGFVAVSALGLVAHQDGAAAEHKGFAGALQLVQDSHPRQMPRQLPSEPKARSELLSELYGYLAKAESAAQSEPIVATIQRLWMISDSPTIDLLMERAMQSIEVGNFKSAQKFLDAVVKLEPDYTEGWNRRAYVFYQNNTPHRALDDLRRVLSIEPNHFQALESVATILRELGEKPAALEAFRKLKALHPQATGLDSTIEELSREVEGEPI